MMESLHILDYLEEDCPLPREVIIDTIEECQFKSKEEFEKLEERLIQGYTDFHEAQMSDIHYKYDVDYLDNKSIIIKRKDGSPIPLEGGHSYLSVRLLLENDIDEKVIHVFGKIQGL